jgi:phosphohistidine phosphatase
LVLCSPARRAIETLEPVRQALGTGAEYHIEPALYGASAAELLELLTQLRPGLASVMVVGHNPGLQDLALLIALNDGSATLLRLRAKFPTAAVATLAVDTGWAEVGPRSARLIDLWTPR